MSTLCIVQVFTKVPGYFKSVKSILQRCEGSREGEELTSSDVVEAQEGWSAGIPRSFHAGISGTLHT